ncbi:MAG: hypothetical protein DCC58_09790, partial [Chloroflexi bacterium]
ELGGDDQFLVQRHPQFVALLIRAQRSLGTLALFRVPILSNRFLVLAALGALLLHTAALYLPPMQYVLGVEPLSIGSWARIVAVALSLLVVVELHMLLRRPRGRTGQVARTFNP